MKKRHTLLIGTAVIIGVVAFIVIQQYPTLTVSRFSPLAGSLVDIGTKGGRTISQISFDQGETSEALPVDHMNIILVPDASDISAGAPLASALTQGKRLFGYKYSSRDAGAEFAAKLRSDNGEPLTYSELFPGSFFVSDEERNTDSFIANFEAQKNISFLPLSAVTLDRQSRYVIIALDADTTMTVQNLMWCGDGTFGPKTEASVLNASTFVLGDVNGDGLIDLVAKSDINTIATQLGHGDGTFSSAITTPHSRYSTMFVLEDVTSDGILDLITSNPTAQTLSVLPGDGAGAFGPETNYGQMGAGGSIHIAVGDLDGDGDEDIAVSSFDLGYMKVLLNDGNGMFVPVGSVIGTLENGGSIAIVDMDGDSDLDIVVVGRKYIPTPTGSAQRDGVLVFLNEGNATFVPEKFYLTETPFSSLVIVDINTDGTPDVVGVSAYSKTLSIFVGQGDGMLGARQDQLIGSRLTAIRAADVNADGILDLLVLDEQSGSLFVLRGRGDGTFEALESYPTSFGPRDVALADLNGDHALDAVMTYSTLGKPGVIFGGTRDTPSCQ